MNYQIIKSIVLFSSISLGSSYLLPGSEKNATASKRVPNQSFFEDFGLYQNENTSTIEGTPYGNLLNFDFNMNDYEGLIDKGFTVLFNQTYQGLLYFKVELENIDGKKVELLNSIKMNASPISCKHLFIFNVNFEDVGEKGKFTFYVGSSKDMVKAIEFYLTSPNIIFPKKQYCEVYQRVKLEGKILTTYYERVKFLNLPKVVYRPYYFNMYTDDIYLDYDIRNPNWKFDIGYIWFKDDYGYIKHAYKESKIFEGFYGDYITSLVWDQKEYIYLTWFAQYHYVDLATLMMSNNSYDFTYNAPTRKIFFPINKYREYKAVEMKLYLENFGQSKTDICYDFLVVSEDRHIQDSLDVERETPIEGFSPRMTELTV